MKWYTLSAEQGDVHSQFNLGWLYDRGSVPPDFKSALKWYKLAAEQGHATAQYILGGMYEFGKGVPKNYNAAEKWYRLAEEQGNANSLRNEHYEPRVCLASPNGRCPEGRVYPARN